MANLFLLVVTSILAANLLWWWLADRLARPLHRGFWWRLLISLFVGGQVTLVLWILGGRVLTDSPLSRPPQVLSSAAYLWHLLILPAAWILMLTTAILFWLWRSGRRFAMWTATGRVGELERGSVGELERESAKPEESNVSTHPRIHASTHPRIHAPTLPRSHAPTRRQFLGMLTAVTPPLLTGGGVAYSLTQLHRFRIRSMDLTLPSLPPELDGVRIALVSYLHAGTFTDSPTVKRIVEETSRLHADLVLLPGDLINNSLSDLSDALDAVSNMQSRHGAYLCIGNQDLIDNGAEFVRRAKARVPLLVDESRIVTIRGHLVQLLGLPWSRSEDRIANAVRQLGRQIAPGVFPILLAHHPHAFDAAAAAGIPLTVSGHTHGGQLMLSDSVGFGPLLYRYWSGLYRKPEHNDAALVVSNGVGPWFPVRTGAPAEIVHLTLRSVVQR